MNIIENYLWQFWRYSSVQLTAIWAALIGWLASSPENMASFMELFPINSHAFVGPMLGFAIFVSIGGARGVTQKKLQK